MNRAESRFSHNLAHFRICPIIIFASCDTVQKNVFGLVLCLTSWSTIFQLFWDGATASWVFTSTLGTLKCLAQGHYTAVMGFKHWTSPSNTENVFKCSCQGKKSVNDGIQLPIETKKIFLCVEV